MRPRQSLPRPIRVAATSVDWKPVPSADGTAMESLREYRAAPQTSILGLKDVVGHSFKKNLCHHSLIFMIEKMAVKDGHAPDYGVGEVHDDVDGAADWNIHRVQPHWIGNRLIVFGVGQEMDLMDMHRMQFASGIYDPPMLKRPNLCAHHRSRVGRKFFSVHVKALLV